MWHFLVSQDVPGMWIGGIPIATVLGGLAHRTVRWIDARIEHRHAERIAATDRLTAAPTRPQGGLMLTKLKATLAAFLATKPGRIVKRVAVTAAVTFATVAGGLAISSGLFTPAHIDDLSLWGKVLAGGESAAVTAALSLVQSLVSQALTGLPTVRALAGKVAR